jgi:hypothetical protein
MYIMIREIAQKAMGETTYNKLGKNTYLPHLAPQTHTPPRQ